MRKSTHYVGGDNVLNRADIKSLSQLAEVKNNRTRYCTNENIARTVNDDSYLWQQKTNHELDKAEETHRKFKQDYKIKLEACRWHKRCGYAQ